MQHRDPAEAGPRQRYGNLGAAARMPGSGNRHQDVEVGCDSRVSTMWSSRDGDREGTFKRRSDARNLRVDFAVGGDCGLYSDQKQVVTLSRFFGNRLLRQLRLLP